MTGFGPRPCIAAITLALLAMTGCADRNAEQPHQAVKTAYIGAAPSHISDASSPSRPVDVNNVSGTKWRVIEIDGQRSPQPANLDAKPAATMVFTVEGRVAGSSSCNGFGGNVRWLPDGGFAHLDMPLIMTAMHCGDQPKEEAATAFGDRFWRILQHARSWKLEGEQMVIQSQDGSTARLMIMR